MEKLSIKLKYCYGIQNFEHDFNFSKGRTHLIYAQNGTMKTSFTNSFERFAQAEKPEERINGNIPEMVVKFDEVYDLKHENVLAIHSLREPTSFEKTSTLLARESLRNRYDIEMRKIEEAKRGIDKILFDNLGKRSYPDTYTEFSIAFSITEDNIDEFLESLESEINGTPIGMSSWARYYKDFFDPSVIKEIKSEPVRKSLTTYISTFQTLAKKSNFFRGDFNHTSAEELGNSLKKAGFFDVKHGVTLRSKGGQIEANALDEYTKLLEEDEEIFFSTKEMRQEYQKLEKVFSKSGLYNIRSMVMEPANSSLIPELFNIDEFRRKVIKSLLQDNLPIYNNWLVVYKSVKIELSKIVVEANADREEWDKIIAEYKMKFHVPFDIEVGNHSDVMLKGKPPALIFKHSGKEVERSLLWKVLSTGEKRAFYILDLLFEIETKKREQKETLIIVDDIADSFDYQNKHAIIEYLKEISQNEKFYIIILTHNFDFFRSVCSRLSVHRDNTWMVYKDISRTRLEPAQDLDPFKILRQECHINIRKFICGIPFVRNLVEYSEGFGGNDYKNLTLCLHIKPNETQIIASQVFDIYKKYIVRNQLLILGFDGNQNVRDLILQESALIITESDDYRIFNKIILSIGIRLFAEKFMIHELGLTGSELIFSGKNQTGSLFEEYKKLPNPDPLLSKVMIVTPENIHFNSFMYEPILDMGFEHLKILYKDIKILSEISSHSP